MRSLDFSIYLILPASNRNEYQESSWGVKGCRRFRLTTSPPSVSRLSRENVGVSTSQNPMGLHGLLLGLLKNAFNINNYSYSSVVTATDYGLDGQGWNPG
jgi:hypothetical protein